MSAEAMTVSACVHCSCMLVRGHGSGAWRKIPALGEVLYPGAAIACPARPENFPHRSPGEVVIW